METPSRICWLTMISFLADYFRQECHIYVSSPRQDTPQKRRKRAIEVLSL